MKKRTLFTLLFIVLFLSPFHVYQTSKAENKTKEELSALISKAKRGDAKAQYNLGVMYYNGQGVKQDYGKARELYTKAAEQGYAGAKAALEVIKKEWS